MPTGNITCGSPGTSVFYTDPGQVTDPALISEMTSWLDPRERSRMQRFVHEHDRHLFLVSHALMRKTLGQLMDSHPRSLVFEHSARGKPFLDPSLYTSAPMFSLSHTAGLAAIAISQSAVGLDVEKLVRNGTEMGVASRFFSFHESEDISACLFADRPRRFLTYWTLKEAFLKAEGWGLIDDLDQFEFHLPRSSDMLTTPITLKVKGSTIRPTQNWSFWTTLVSDSHILSVASCHATSIDPGAANIPGQVRCEFFQHSQWLA